MVHGFLRTTHNPGGREELSTHPHGNLRDRVYFHEEHDSAESLPPPERKRRVLGTTPGNAYVSEWIQHRYSGSIKHEWQWWPAEPCSPARRRTFCTHSPAVVGEYISGGPFGGFLLFSHHRHIVDSIEHTFPGEWIWAKRLFTARLDG